MNIDTLLEHLVIEIKEVKGVSAIVLGGSRARGTHTANSDIDLGIYYNPQVSIDLQALNRVAANFDDQNRSQILTPIGGWGPWINGGGWLTIHKMPVDFIYRDLQKVADIVGACQQGQIEIAYQPGHPQGFLSSIYMGELAICKILWEDTTRTVSTLKTQTTTYPIALKQAIIDKFGWEIDFSIGIARKSIQRGDVLYAAGCCFRAAACMLQTLFAINGQYWLNEKGAVIAVDGFEYHPENFKTRIENVFRILSPTGQDIQKALDTLTQLAEETNKLTAINSKNNY